MTFRVQPPAHSYMNAVAQSLKQGQQPVNNSQKTADFGSTFFQNPRYNEQEALERAIKATDPAKIQAKMLSSRTNAGGLFNIGNTCWMNSLIQMFKHSPFYIEKITIKAKQDNLLAQTILNIINLSERSAQATRPITTINREMLSQLEVLRDLFTDFEHGQQHDPTEAFQFVLNTLDIHSDPLNYKTYSRAVLSSDASSIKLIPMTQITLSKQNMPSIQDGVLQEFMTPSLLANDEGINFSNKGKQDAYKVDYFVHKEGFSVPSELTIQVPRFTNEIDPLTHQRKKNSSPIEFNDRVYIPLYSENGERVIKVMLMNLHSVIAHQSRKGQANTGHYIAYQKVRNNFLLYNDAATPKEISSRDAKKAISIEGYIANYVLEKVLDPKEASIPCQFKTLNQVLPPVPNPAETNEVSIFSDDEDDWFFVDPAPSKEPLSTNRSESQDEWVIVDSASGKLNESSGSLALADSIPTSKRSKDVYTALRVPNLPVSDQQLYKQVQSLGIMRSMKRRPK